MKKTFCVLCPNEFWVLCPNELSTTSENFLCSSPQWVTTSFWPLWRPLHVQEDGAKLHHSSSRDKRVLENCHHSPTRQVDVVNGIFTRAENSNMANCGDGRPRRTADHHQVNQVDEGGGPPDEEIVRGGRRRPVWRTPASSAATVWTPARSPGLPGSGPFFSLRSQALRDLPRVNLAVLLSLCCPRHGMIYAVRFGVQFVRFPPIPGPLLRERDHDRSPSARAPRWCTEDDLEFLILPKWFLRACVEQENEKGF